MTQIPGLSIQIEVMLDKMLLGGATLRDALVLQYYKFLDETVGEDIEELYGAGWRVEVKVYQCWFHMKLVFPEEE